MPLNVAEAERPPGANTNDAREPLRENPPRAPIRRASEPPRENRDDDHQPLPGKVGKRASISAMDTTRCPAADRTARRRSRGSGQDADLVATGPNPENGQASRDHRQQVVG